MPYGYGDSPLMAMGSQSDPVFVSQPPVLNPTLRLPGMSPQHTAIIQMMVEPLIRSFLPQGPYAPGQMFSQQNLFSQMMVRRDLQEMEQAMMGGMRLDQARWMQVLEGQARMLGTQFNPQAAAQLTGDFANMIGMPLARFAPGIYSDINGGRDAVTMAREMWLGGRFGIDPVSGMPRMSPLAAQATMNESYGHFFGPNANPQAAGGLSSYQLGGLYNQFMTNRMGPGMAPSPVDSILGVGALGGAGDIFSQLTSMANGPQATQIENNLRNFDAQRTRQFLQSLTRAFGGLQDILTDQGHGNASPAELFNIMQSLTQNSMQHMGPAGMERFITQLRGTSSVTGQPIEQIARSIMAARPYTDALGMTGDAATRAGMSGMMAADAAGRVLGLNAYLSPGQMLHAQISRFSQAEGSAAAMQMAATLHLADTFGGGNESVQALTAAIRSGATHFTDPVTGVSRPVAFQNENEWQALLRSGLPISAETITAARGSTALLRPIIGQNNLGATVYQMQNQLNIQPMMQRFMQSGLEGALSGTGLDVNQISQLAARGFLGAPGIDASRTTNVDALMGYIQGQPGMQAMSPTQSNALRQGLVQGLGNISAYATSQGTTPQAIANTYSEQNQRQYLRQQRLASLRGALDQAFSGVNRSNFSGRLLNLLQNAGPETSLMDAAASLLGLIPMGGVREQAMHTIRVLDQARRQYLDMEPNADPREIENVMSMIRQDIAALLGVLPADLDDTLRGSVIGGISDRANAMTGIALSMSPLGGLAGAALFGTTATGQNAAARSSVAAAAPAMAALAALGPGGLLAGAGVLAEAIAPGSTSRPAAGAAGGVASNMTVRGTLMLITSDGDEIPAVIAAEGATNAGQAT